MLECLIIGDSIAQGIHAVAPQCEVRAKVGANTDFIVNNYKTAKHADYTVISMGSNWPDNPRNFANAVKLRQSLTGSELVIWILPYNRKAADTVRRVAKQYGDNYIDLSAFGSNDRVHPKSYGAVNKEIQQHVLYFYK
jgi:hypothetical protein